MGNVELFTEAGLKVNITLRGALVKIRQPYDQRSHSLRQHLKLDQGCPSREVDSGGKPVCSSWDYAEPKPFDRDNVMLMSWWW